MFDDAESYKLDLGKLSIIRFLIYFSIYKFHLSVSIEIVFFFFFTSFFIEITFKNINILLEDD
jgi:hypothetical protein